MLVKFDLGFNTLLKGPAGGHLPGRCRACQDRQVNFIKKVYGTGCHS